MKLYTSENAELMEVSALKREGNSLIVEGTIMGAMPIQAVLRPPELRAGFKLLNPRIVLFILSMMFKQ
jgi:hypothetical protein